MMTCAIQQNRPCWAGELAKLPHKPSSKGDFAFIPEGVDRHRYITRRVWGPTYQLNAISMDPLYNKT